jgi:uncharacterized membrane protein YhaH (DUF805 family)
MNLMFRPLCLFQDFAWKKSVNTDGKEHGQEFWLSSTPYRIIFMILGLL